MKYILLSLLVFFISLRLNSQTIDIFDIDYSEFPIVKAKFFAFDSVGDQVTNLNITDFNIREDNQDRKVLSVKCFTHTSVEPVSTILVMDASGSMRGRNLMLAKSAANAWINAMPDGESECAITAFSDENFMIQDFTSNKILLQQKIKDLFANGGTKYNYAFIEEPFGGLIISQNAQFKKVLVLMTDGRPTDNPDIDRIVNDALVQNVIVFAVTLGMPCPIQLQTITERTGGEWFENVSTPDEATSIYQKILQRIIGVEPCEIIWESDVTCYSGERLVDIDFYPFNLNKVLSYPSPKNALTGLTISPESVFFKNVQPGNVRDTTVTITANNGDMNVSDITWTNQSFSIYPKSFNIKKGESQKLQVTYTAPQDVSYVWTKFELINNLCKAQIFASGGFAGKKPSIPTLKLESPNGGEVFVAGSDTNILWSGIPDTDAVRLEYSYDNGLNWNIVENKTTGSNYSWIKIPNTPSTECLMKVKQLKSDIGNNIHWAKRMGGNFLNNWEDRSTGITIDESGNIYIISQYQNTIDIDGFSITSNGMEDVFISKINSNGNIDWIKSIGGEDREISGGIAVDSWGNVFVTGRFSHNIDLDDRSLFSNGGSDIFVAKYLPDGTIEWAKNFGGTGDDLGNAISIDNLNNLYVTGAFSNSAIFENSTLKSDGDFDIFLSKLSPEGKLIWLRKGGGESHDEATGVTVDLNGRVLITGKFSKKAQFGNTELISGGINTELPDFDIFVAKYLTNGALEWVVNAGGPGDDEAMAIDTDTKGNPYITGKFSGKATFGNELLESRGDNTNFVEYDVFISKLQANGDFLWSKRAGSKSLDIGYSIAVDLSDNAIITGAFTDIADFGKFDLTSSGFNDIFVAKYNFEGEVEWAKRGGGLYGDYGMAVALDSWGNAYVNGNFIQQGNFDKSVLLTDNGESDVFIWGVGGGDDGLQEDTSDFVWSIVSPKYSAQIIDMGSVFVGSSKDSLVEGYIINSGNYKFRIDSISFKGNDASAFDLVSGFPPFNIENGNSQDLEFRFFPIKEGLNEADIIIYSQADSLKYRIFGNGLLPDLKVINSIIDFGKVLVGESKDTFNVVTITNKGSKTIEIIDTKHNLPNAIDFTIISGGGKFQLKSGDTAKLDLRFSPSVKGKTGGILEFHFDGSGSPVKVQLIGEGINPNPSIMVSNNYFEDLDCDFSSSAIIKVSNFGGDNLVISNIEFAGNNPEDFKVNSAFPINIKPDETKDVEVEFNTDIPGIKSADMIFISNAIPDTIKSVALNVRLNAAKGSTNKTNVDFGLIDLNQSADDKIILTNIGNKTSTFNIKTNGIFEIDKSSVLLFPNQKVEIQILFSGSDVPAILNNELIIIDTLCNTQIIIPIKLEVAKIERPLISAIFDSFEDILCTDKSISNLNITNKGKEILSINTVTIEGNDKDDFEIISDYIFDLNQSESEQILIEFKPLLHGKKTAELVIFSNSETNNVLRVPISAEYHNPEFSIQERSVNVGDIVINDTKNFEFNLINTGSIKNKYIMEYPDEIQLSENEILLDVGESHKFNGIFTGKILNDEYLKYISVTDTACGQTAQTGVFAKIVKGTSIFFRVGDAEGDAGDIIQIPVYLNAPDGIDLGEISFDLSFNSTLLSPNFETISVINNGIRTIKFNKIKFHQNDDKLLINTQFIVGLGNSQTTELTLSDIKSDKISNINFENGIFNFLGICEEGGNRLINPDNNMGMFRVNPNPAGSNINISINLIEKGETKIVIYNYNGVEYKHYEFVNQIGSINLYLDINDFENGMYFIHLQTPTIREIQKLIILK